MKYSGGPALKMMKKRNARKKLENAPRFAIGQGGTRTLGMSGAAPSTSVSPDVYPGVARTILRQIDDYPRRKEDAV